MCTNSVDHLIQCDRCLNWYCCTCGKVSEHLITVLDEFKELYWFCHKCDAIAINTIQAFNSTESTPGSDTVTAVTGIITTAIQSLQEARKTTINDLVSAKTCSNPTQEMIDDDCLIKTTLENLAHSIVSEQKEKEEYQLNLV